MSAEIGDLNKITYREKAAEILVQLLCGSIGGGISSFITYPLTNIRLRSIVKNIKDKELKAEPTLKPKKQDMSMKNGEFCHCSASEQEEEVANKDDRIICQNNTFKIAPDEHEKYFHEEEQANEVYYRINDNKEQDIKNIENNSGQSGNTKNSSKNNNPKYLKHTMSNSTILTPCFGDNLINYDSDKSSSSNPNNRKKFRENMDDIEENTESSSGENNSESLTKKEADKEGKQLFVCHSGNSSFSNSSSTSKRKKHLIEALKYIANMLTNYTNYVNPMKTNFYKQLRKIIRTEGVFGLYKGALTSVICSVVQNGSHFCLVKLFELLIELKYPNIVKKKSIALVMLVNFLAALCTAVITNPIEVINTRMATCKSQLRKITDKISIEEGMTNLSMISNIYDQEGFSGFFKGIVPSLVLTMYPVIQFTAYEYLKGIFEKRNKFNGTDMSNTQIVVLSFFSKCFATTINYPLITIKSLFQYNSGNSDDTVKAIKNIYKEKGFLAFYNGMMNKLVSSQFNNIALMMIYEKMQAFIRFTVFSMIFGFQIKP